MTGLFAARYFLDSPLGHGTIGEVWKAKDTKLDRWVALKLLSNITDADLAYFRREAHITAALSHPNIATLYDIGDAQVPYIAIQFVDGKNLNDLARLEARRAAAIIRDAARGVGYAHSLGVVHRDLSPANIIVTDAGHVRVTDFGLARSLEAPPSVLSNPAIRVGTPPYIAPAQVKGEPADTRSDVYALGAILKQLAEDPPRALRAVIAKATALDPSKRHPTADQLADDLDRFLRPKSRRWTVAAACLAGLAVAGFAVLQLAPAKEVVRVSPAAALFDECYFQWREGLYAEMESTASRAIAADPKNWVGFQLRAMARMQAGKMAEARGDIDAMLARGPDKPDARCLFGRYLLKTGDIDGAIGQFDRAVELAANDPKAREAAEGWKAVALKRKKPSD